MTTKTKSASLDPRPPVVMPGDEKINNTTVKPPTPMKKKRKPRSDKGKMRKPRADNTHKAQDEPLNGVGLSANAKRLKKLYKPFDEKRISDNWLMQVWPCWNNFDKYEIRFVFDGVRYGYKQTFDDASLAVALGMQYLDHRYKNKASYVS
jgi:hypothetical protein